MAGGAGLTRHADLILFNHMVNSRAERLDETFFALSDPTRRAILSRLAQGRATVADLRQPFDLSAPAISKHLRVLERAGLLRQEREGRVRWCHLDPTPLKEAADFVERYRLFWEKKLDQFAAYVEETLAKNDQSKPPRPGK